MADRTGQISPNAAHLLVVDDDDRIRDLLKRFLTGKGFRVSVAQNATEARHLLSGLRFDLIVLDVMMPGEDGFALTKSLRNFDSVPILLLTARGEPSDRITGLSLGADDYLSKPFEPEELVLRIQAILKREASVPRAKSVKFANWVFDLDRQLLTNQDERVHLTSGELALLDTLSRRVGTPVSRHALAQQVNAPSERAVDVQITRLRRKLEADPSKPEFLLTVRNHGYVLQAIPYEA